MRTEDSATGPCYWSRLRFIICYFNPFDFMENTRKIIVIEGKVVEVVLIKIV